jgi:GNAT superfamily N-acetyltransferase
MEAKSRCQICLETEPSPDDVRSIRQGLETYNRLYAPDDNYQSMTVLLRTADQRLVGGLLGETYWGWLHIGILWLDESVRHQGYGSRLLAAAEQEAIRRGCLYAHLDTMSFQAVGFYQQHGYVEFGVLQDLPAGHRRHFFVKTLAPDAL